MVPPQQCLKSTDPVFLEVDDGLIIKFEKFPTLTANRLSLMVRERGYGGGADAARR